METPRFIRFGVDCPLIRSAVVFRDPGHMYGRVAFGDCDRAYTYLILIAYSFMFFFNMQRV